MVVHFPPVQGALGTCGAGLIRAWDWSTQSRESENGSAKNNQPNNLNGDLARRAKGRKTAAVNRLSGFVDSGANLRQSVQSFRGTD